MTRFRILFDRAYFPNAIFEGTLTECRAFIGEVMVKPHMIKGKKVLVSHAAVWGADKDGNLTKKCYGEYQMGADDKIRIGMWWDAPTDKHYLLHRNGSLADEIERYNYDFWARKEYRTRVSKVKNM